MKQLITSCKLLFELTVSTPFVFMLRPRSGLYQWVSSDSYVFNPSVYVSEFTDIYGNLCQRIVAPAGEFTVATRAEVIVSSGVDRAVGGEFIEVQNLPDHAMIFLLPSRYCDAEYFGQIAAEITAEAALGFDQVAAIEQWIRNVIRYEVNSNDAPVAASEVYRRGWGVCRDFAHLGIALCRALSIPARMVAGYLHGLEPMDMHAWFEAYVAGRWYLFDPTQATPKEGYVVLGYGRDAADVAVYNQFGPAVYPLEQTVSVECNNPGR